MSENTILENMTREFSGFDGGDPGCSSRPSIWLMGIEPGLPQGDSPREKATTPYQSNDCGEPNNYSVEMQMRWPFNQKIFKLLAVIESERIEDWRMFANDKKPFQKGSKGYFKGNIYPLPCPSEDKWPIKYQEISGLEKKTQYKSWCKENRHPKIASWVDKYKPRLIIGVGLGHRNEFSSIVDGNCELEEYSLADTRPKHRLFVKKGYSTSLVVVPHLSGARLSDHSILKIGEFIKSKITPAAI